MVLIRNDTQHPYYTRNDLYSMNMLLRPIWVFDIDKKAMYWANTAAIEQVWNADTLDELIQRDFASDMSDATASFLADVKRKILQDPYRASTVEQWTFYPRGGEHATTIDITCSGIMIDDSDSTKSTGRIAMLVEAEMLQNERTLNERTVRSIELLKHIPVAVSQFTMDGTKLIHQNPKASQLFGSPLGHESSTTDLNYSSEDLNVVSDANESHDERDVNKETQRVQRLDETLPEHGLLERFVDVELVKNAIAMITEKDEEFRAEVQQYTTTTTTTTHIASTERLYKRRHSKGKNKSYSQPPREQRWFNVSLRKTRDPVTSDFIILYIATDISDIVKARNDSLRAAMKSEFLDVMAHEIRTPLHQIIGHTDLLEDTSTNCLCTGGVNPLNSEQLESVRQIQSSCSMLISIINDLLDCSKLENGKVLKEEIQFDLETLISSCIESMRPQLQSKKGLLLSYHIDAACDTSKLISDPSRLRQILHNLLSNAIKFSSVGSVTVTVQPFNNKYYNSNDTDNTIDPLAMSEGSSSIDSIYQDDRSESVNNLRNVQHIQFEVTDTGIGIAPNEQNVVFERYRQANTSVARNFGGTGLGLPICKGLVELLGGRIGLRSTSGIGTTVYFDIPFLCSQSSASKPHGMDTTTLGPFAVENKLPVEATSSNPTNTTDESSKPIGLNILVVEDNVINQKVVNSMLKRLGHIVSIAENGEIALTLIRQKQFHLVLMDVQMPVMDGIECTKYIRNVMKISKEFFPIVGLTAGYQPTDRDYYQNDVGMNTCFGKPLPMNKLKEAIETYCCRQPKQKNTDTDRTTVARIVDIDEVQHSSNFPLPVAISMSRSPSTATLKRELEVSAAFDLSKQTRSELDSRKQQQHQFNEASEPTNKKKR